MCFNLGRVGRLCSDWPPSRKAGEGPFSPFFEVAIATKVRYAKDENEMIRADQNIG